MKPSNNGEREPIGHLLSNEASSTGTGLHLIELLINEAHGNLQTTQAEAKTGCSLQDSKAPLLKTHTTH